MARKPTTPSTEADEPADRTAPVAPPAESGVSDPGVPGPAGTDDVSASGAIIEPAIVDALPMGHPAIDSNPRANVPPESNRIDFNDPVSDGQTIVERRTGGTVTSETPAGGERSAE